MNISFIINLLLLNITSQMINLPVVVLHGIASSKDNTEEFATWLSFEFNQEVYNIDIGDGIATSLFTPMNSQLSELCKVIYDIPRLKYGFNFIGMSQGGLLARGYVERCNKYPVNNLITLVSPHGGVYDIDKAIKNVDMYSEFIQEQLSFSNYWRDPKKLNEYIKKCSYLPDINNERDFNDGYKKNIESLNNFVMVWTKNDEVLGPPESAKFGVYDFDYNVVDMIDTNVYKYDYIGLKKLNEENKLFIYETNCSHVDHIKPQCFPQIYDIMLKFLN